LLAESGNGMICCAKQFWKVEILSGGGPMDGRAKAWSKDLCNGWLFGQSSSVNPSRMEEFATKKAIRRQTE